MRVFPGLDPNRLTMDRYEGLLERAAEIREAEGGRVDYRARVARMKRRKKRGW